MIDVCDVVLFRTSLSCSLLSLSDKIKGLIYNTEVNLIMDHKTCQTKLSLLLKE